MGTYFCLNVFIGQTKLEKSSWLADQYLIDQCQTIWKVLRVAQGLF
jgi:hypothetical protein